MDRAYASGAIGTPPAAPASPSIGYPQPGNPATAVPATKPGPYFYHMIMEELMAVVTAAGITPAQGNLTQLLTALRSAGVFTTPAQFDNTTKVATTAFVRSAKGGTAGVNAFNNSTTLTLDDVGKQVFFYGSTAGQTITLPAAETVPAGEGYWITNQASVAVTLKGNGSQNLSVNLAGAGKSLSNTTVLKSGDSLFVPSNSANQWNIHGYTSDGQFPSSLAASGYQKLPSGLIIQWGACTTPASATIVTLPVAFPNAGLALIMHNSQDNNNFAVGYTLSTTQFYTHTSNGTTAQAWWIAIGY